MVFTKETKDSADVAISVALVNGEHVSPTSLPPEETGIFSKSPYVKKFLRKRLPVLEWLPKYRLKKDLVMDGIAGVTVGLTAIPQSMAYANVGGLSPEFGLYSSFISCFVYLFLGTCRQMTIGPTALMELLIYEACGPGFPACVILTGFWVGVIQLLMGILKLGAMVTLISDPVTIGFVAGASLTICSSQLKAFFGLNGSKGEGFVGNVRMAIDNFHTLKLSDTSLGIGCVLALWLMKNLKDWIKPTSPIFAKFLWVLNIGRNALVVIVCSVLAASFKDPPFALTGMVKPGFPPISLPQFELPYFPEDHNRNKTLYGTDGVTISPNGSYTFWETWAKLGTAPLMIAIISILQNVAIAKAFGSGQSIDATQEMIALGVSHIFACFFSAMPVAGSFTRSVVNEASGVRSPIGGIFTGVIVILSLSFLTQWFAYIPKPSLAAVILCAVLPMIEYESIIPMWKVSKADVLTTFVTFLASLFLGMEYGIIIGVILSLSMYFRRPVRPIIACSIVQSDISANLMMETEKNNATHHLYHLVQPEQGFLFPSVDAIRTKINKLALAHPMIEVIALDCERWVDLDFTSASSLCSLVKALEKTGKRLVFLNCTSRWEIMMKNVGLERPECYESIKELEESLKN